MVFCTVADGAAPLSTLCTGIEAVQGRRTDIRGTIPLRITFLIYLFYLYYVT